MELISKIFQPRYKNAIFRIPASALSNSEDCWMWKYTKNGSYSVRSGYRLLTCNLPMVETNLQAVWKCICKMLTSFAHCSIDLCKFEEEPSSGIENLSCL